MDMDWDYCVYPCCGVRVNVMLTPAFIAEACLGLTRSVNNSFVENPMGEVLLASYIHYPSSIPELQAGHNTGFSLLYRNRERRRLILV